MKAAAKENANFFTDQLFLTLANSEFCDETFTTIAYEMSYEDFLQVEYRVRYMEDLKNAAEKDHEREEARKQITR